jgi:hypothetical protein
MPKTLLLFVFLYSLVFLAQAQVDSTQWGSIDLHGRLFLMNTNNEGELRDYFASALGLGLGYQTPEWRGFHARISGFYTQGLYTTDLVNPDPKSGARNRYEIGLFDVFNPESRSIFRVEDLYLHYQEERSYLRIGRQVINTPFINPQDGRMSPSYVQGAYGRFQKTGSWHLEGGWLNGMSPRGTSRWFKVGESMGAFPQGLSADGNRAQYLSQIQSKGIGIIKIGVNPNNKLSLQAWNTFVENVLNISLVQADMALPLNEKYKLLLGAQGTILTAVNDGGNPDRELTYLMPDCASWVFSSRIGIGNQRGEITANYTNISGRGRFQFPREWGRDPFYTFMPRERNEGYGDVEALVFKTRYQVVPGLFQAEFGHGWFQLPAANDARLNKYGLPSYHQTNLDLRYTPNSSWNLQYLAVYKGANGNTFDNLRYVHNKVNMLYHNIVLNFFL